MFETAIQNIGLSKDQSLIYDLLLTNSPATAGQLSKLSGFKRGWTYKLLDQLEEMRLVERIEIPRKTLHFKPGHPLRLKELAQEKIQSATNSLLSLEASLPSIITNFNLISGMPGVSYYEGIDGIKKVLFDALTSKTEIYAFADLPSVKDQIAEMTAEFSKKRAALKIKKKGIAIDSPEARQFLKNHYPEVTKTKYVRMDQLPSFDTVMQIYDQKVSYITYRENRFIGVIIEDPSISAMHKYYFEFMWKYAPGEIV
jgi:sugar-specific transcriptional regulator TrmB